MGIAAGYGRLFDNSGVPMCSLGYYFLELNNTKLIETEDDERNLLLRYKKHRDQEAKRLLAEAHLVMVVRMAKRYERNKQGADIEDLIGSGNFGLLKAIDFSVDIDLRSSFSGFAKVFIDRAMIQEMYGSFHTCRLPSNIQRTISRLKRSFPTANWGHHNAPQADYVIEILYDESIKSYKEKKGFFPKLKIRNALLANLKWNVEYAIDHLALENFNKIIEVDKEFDIAKYGKFVDPEEALDYSELRSFIKSFLEELPLDDHEILHRYLIKEDTPSEIAKDFQTNGDHISKKIWRNLSKLKEYILLKLNFLDIETIENVVKMYEETPIGVPSGYMRQKCIRNEIARRLQVDYPLIISNEDLCRLVQLKIRIKSQNEKMREVLSVAENMLHLRFEREIGFLVDKIMNNLRNKGILIEKNDLCQEAQIALLQIFQKYDFSRGIKLSTFVKFCLTRAVLKEVQRLLGTRRKNKISFISMEEYCSSETSDGVQIFEISDDRIDQSMQLEVNQQKGLFQERMKAAMENLTQEEKNVLRLLYPMDSSQKPMTNKVAYTMLGITEKKILKLKKTAMNKIRDSLDMEFGDMVFD